MRIQEDFTNELVTVREHGIGKSKNKGTPYVWIDFVFDELKGDDEGEITARAVLYLTDKTIDHVVPRLTLLGWTGRDIFELDKSGSNRISLLGAKARITGHVTLSDDGKYYETVDFINDVDYTPDNILGNDELKILSNRLAGKIAAYREKNKNEQKAKAKTEDGE